MKNKTLNIMKESKLKMYDWIKTGWIKKKVINDSMNEGLNVYTFI